MGMGRQDMKRDTTAITTRGCSTNSNGRRESNMAKNTKDEKKTVKQFVTGSIEVVGTGGLSILKNKKATKEGHK